MWPLNCKVISLSIHPFSFHLCPARRWNLVWSCQAFTRFAVCNWSTIERDSLAFVRLLPGNWWWIFTSIYSPGTSDYNLATHKCLRFTIRRKRWNRHNNMMVFFLNVRCVPNGAFYVCTFIRKCAVSNATQQGQTGVRSRVSRPPKYPPTFVYIMIFYAFVCFRSPSTNVSFH